jgi:transglutaminase-like putative cysteine protease
MLIRIGYDLEFEAPAPVTMQLLLLTHPSRSTDLRRPDEIQSEPQVPVATFLDGFGNRCARVKVPAGRIRFFNDTTIEDSGMPDPVDLSAEEHDTRDLPPETLQYLLASRYCEVDRMSDIAWELFGDTPRGWHRVQAICDWVHNHITFGYQHARSTKTAMDAYYERKGVCRDFMHLAITFCRCLNIPARYANGYLGDIGVPRDPSPMDFSAWFEVYLGGRWHTFDARHNKRRIGRVLMATGRDAVDAALTTSFGTANLRKFFVRTDEL